MRKARSTVSALVTLWIAAGFALTATGQANAADSGSVDCVDGEPVVGVWVDVQDGDSGWARRSGQGSHQGWSYNTQGRPYSLNVGCGDSPQHWRSSSSTYGYATNWVNLNCWPGPAERYGDGGMYAPIDHCVRA